MSMSLFDLIYDAFGPSYTGTETHPVAVQRAVVGLQNARSAHGNHVAGPSGSTSEREARHHHWFWG